MLLGAVLLCISCASAASAPPKWHELSENYSHDEYMGHFGKSYKLQELAKRRALFHTNLRSILQHNADKRHSYKMGVNQFTDWSSQEFQRLNGLTPHIHREALQFPSANWVEPKTTALPLQVDWRDHRPTVISAVKDQVSTPLIQPILL